MICKTTRAHFEKFCAMRNAMGVSFLNSDRLGTKAQLTKMFIEDPLLNQIPLGVLDKYYPYYSSIRPSISKAEAVCVIKHSLIYQVIGATPEFID